MFIEQLTREQLILFAKEFLKKSKIKNIRLWKITIECTFVDKNIIDIKMTKKIDGTDYKIVIRMSGDFRVDSIKNAQIDAEELKKLYVNFMYNIFGEPYRYAYLTDADKIFE